MLRFWTLLTCTLLLGSTGLSQAEPLDSPDTVYINELPCNSACQSYMGLFRHASRRRQAAAPVSLQPSSLQPVGRPTKAKVQRSTKSATNNTPRARMARTAAPKTIDVPPAKAADVPPVETANVQPADTAEARPPLPEKTADAPPISNPAPASEASKTPEPVATAPAVEALTTATASAAVEQKTESDTKPSAPAETMAPAVAETAALAAPGTASAAAEQKVEGDAKPSDRAEAMAPTAADTAALASPAVAEPQVAILVVRQDIEAVADLANKTVAIDVVRSQSVPRVRTAIAAAGAQVQLSESDKLALSRVMDGDVPAAVVTLTSPEEAEMWSAGVPGFRILRVPLAPVSGSRG